MSTQLTFSPHSHSAGLLAAFKSKLSELRFERQKAKSQRQEIARVTQELSICSDRQLADLGFRRSDIPEVARGLFGRV